MALSQDYDGTNTISRPELDIKSYHMFRHKSLAPDRNCVRLVRFNHISGVTDIGNRPKIQCRVEHFDLTSRLVFRAVSYTWGNDMADHLILMNGEHFAIRPNLYGFLEQLRDSELEWLWIDQLCIDQDSVNERNQQVKLMSQIFSQAACVFAWLGSRSSDSDLAMDVLEDCESAPVIHGRLEAIVAAREWVDFWTLQTEARRSAVISLLSRKFWSRVWIVQELFLAQRLVLLCGSRRLNIRLERLDDPYYGALGIMSDRSLYKLMEHGVGMETRAAVLASLGLLMIVTTAQSSREGGVEREDEKRFLSVPGAIALSVRRRCAEPHDHIYGIQACIPDQLRINVNYAQPAADVYAQFIRGLSQELIRRKHTARLFSIDLPEAMGLPLTRKAQLQKELLKARMRARNALNSMKALVTFDND